VDIGQCGLKSEHRNDGSGIIELNFNRVNRYDLCYDEWWAVVELIIAVEIMSRCTKLQT